MLAVRHVWGKPYINSLPLTKRSHSQARLDIALYTGAGVAMALYNFSVYGYPFFLSGFKLVIGMITLGLFAAMDLALEKEREVIQAAHETADLVAPPHAFTPMTNRFLMLAAGITVLFAIILGMIISQDIWLLNAAGPGAQTSYFVADMRRSIILEILFVMAILLVLVINSIYSWSRNIRMLFESQTTTLRRVSEGNMDTFIPVTSRDEFGYIAGHTNRMIEGLRDRIRLMEGVKVAQEVQQTFLPKSAPKVAGLEIAARSLFCDETGGDFYDFITPAAQQVTFAETEEIDAENGLSVVLGDVTGHGIGAAMLMASVRASIRAYAAKNVDPAHVLSGANTQLVKDSYGTGRFVTLFYLQILPCQQNERTISWANAGHDPALVYAPATGDFSELKATGLPLGVIAGGAYTAECCMQLSAGTIFLLGTDGIWETQNEAGEMYGKQRLKQIISQNAQRSAQQLMEKLITSVEDFRGSMPQEDDLTVVIIKASEEQHA